MTCARSADAGPGCHRTGSHGPAQFRFPAGSADEPRREGHAAGCSCEVEPVSVALVRAPVVTALTRQGSGVAVLADGVLDLAQAVLGLALDLLDLALRLELLVAGQLADAFLDGALGGVAGTLAVLVGHQTLLLAPRDMRSRATKMTTMSPASTSR